MRVTQTRSAPKTGFTRGGLIQNTPLLGIVLNNFLVLGIKLVTMFSGYLSPPKKYTLTRKLTKCPNDRLIRQGLIQNTPLLGIVVNNFLVLGIEEHDLTRMPIMPFLRSQRTNEGYSMPSHSVSFSVYSFSHLNCKCTRKWGIFSLVGDLLHTVHLSQILPIMPFLRSQRTNEG